MKRHLARLCRWLEILHVRWDAWRWGFELQPDFPRRARNYIKNGDCDDDSGG